MGVGRSRQLPITYEQACRRVSRNVLTRIEETFKKMSTINGYLPQMTFMRDVMGDGVPQMLAEGIYHAFGGTQKGIGLKDLLCGLVLLSQGSSDEKAKFLAQMLSLDGEFITKETLQKLVLACDGHPSPVNTETLFLQDFCTIEHFEHWIKHRKELASFTKWLLVEKETGFKIEAEPDPPTFYQTLAEEHELTEKDVMNLEKTYWGLKGSGKFDLETFEKYACPPVPEELCEGLFKVFDVNCDGHIDLSEMVKLVSICCRKSEEERHKLCFKVFDCDGDGLLDRGEMTRATELLKRLREENTPDERERSGTLEEEEGERGQTQVSAEAIVESALSQYGREHEGHVTEREYIEWALSNDLSQELSSVMFEICHMRFGLRPRNKKDEGRVVSGYMFRFKKVRRKAGDTVYLIAARWFHYWREYTSEGNSPSPGRQLGSTTRKNKRKKIRKTRSSSTVAQAQVVTEVPMTNGGRNDLEEVAEEALELVDMPNVESEVSTVTSDNGQRPEPIDNSILCMTEPTGSKKLPSLTNEGGRLLKHSQLLVEGNDFVLLPEVVWRVFTIWYGTVGHHGGPALPRMVHEDGKVELYPVVFKIYRHTTVPPPVKASSLPWPLASFFSTLMGTTNQPPMPLITGGVAETNPTQPPLPRRVPYYQAAFDATSTVQQICDQMQRMLHVKPEDLRIYDFSDEDRPILLDDETAVIQNLHFQDGQKLLVETRNKDNSWPEEMIAIVKEVQARDKDREKNKIQQDVRVPPGATGLSNLGNTCFMNSALQCVSNTQPLTNYFREKDYLLEINKDNPLGMGGVMAKRYGELIQDLWEGETKSITPLKFRFTMGRCAPRFNGFQQQDAQELLAFVLDGLHEDLNRVNEKPYLELKDSDGRPDEEVAKEAWDYHLSRNQSVIVDLFQGQLKSEVSCKVCGYKSVRFDPFTFLSLPLPMESTVDLEVIVVRLDGSQPVRYGLKVEMDERYRVLKKSLSQLSGIPSSSLLLVEVHAAMIRNFPSDTTKIRSVLGGWLYCYETPRPSSPESTPRSDSPDEIYQQRMMEHERTLSMKEEEEERAAEVREERPGEEGSSQDPLPETVERISSEANDRSTLPSQLHPLNDRETHATPTSEDVRTHATPTLDDNCTEEETKLTPTDEHPLLPTVEGLVSGATPTDHQSDPRGIEDTDEVSNMLGGAGKSAGGVQQLAASPVPPSSWDVVDGFIFAVHRKIYPVEHFFVACQKNRPSLFGIPLVVPCIPGIPQREVYKSIWTQVKRLIIPDPPSVQMSHEKEYPFQLKWVGRDGLSCAICPWYKFCRGCLLACDDTPLGSDRSCSDCSCVAMDWDNTTLHLKYQSAQERPIDHESMESLKTMNTDPIDLYECFKSFVREEQLGEEECWYCKQCKKHQEATKTLEIWRLPPILIIHVKRFQFFNGRWVKSQRMVRFPIHKLEPMRYTVQNGNGRSEHGDRESDSPSNSIQLSAEVHTSEAGMNESVDGEAPADQVTNEDQLPLEPEEVEGASSDPERATDTSNIYNLFAISCHTGVLGGGHYTSFARNPNGMWYYYNDSSCKETTEDRISEESPYLLFYQLEGLEHQQFRAKKQGKKQDIGRTEDDREFEETLKSLRSRCCIQ